MDFVRSVCLDSGEVMVSFDVVSLFMKIPVELALWVVRWYLESDDTLQDRTNLGIDEIVSLLSLCLNATHFSFRGVIYQQIFGTAMGSPVSVVVANLVMEDIEGRALDTFSSPVKCWKRYVDDVLCVVARHDIESLLQHINNIEPSIQFTFESQSEEGCLPFLDVMLRRDEDGSISTSVYRKPTHTDKYLDFSSHHPIAHKASVVKTLFSRADTLSSSPTNISDEQERIYRALITNHYPRSFVNRVIRKKPSISPSNRDRFFKTITIPYIRGVSEAVQRALEPAKVRVVFQPNTTLRRRLKIVHQRRKRPM